MTPEDMGTGEAYEHNLWTEQEIARSADAASHVSANVRPFQRTVILPRACSRCDYSAKEGKDTVCRFEPPKVAFIPMPGQQMLPGPSGLRAVPTVEIRPVGGFPVVQPDQWCGKFEPRKGEG